MSRYATFALPKASTSLAWLVSLAKAPSQASVSGVAAAAETAASASTPSAAPTDCAWKRIMVASPPALVAGGAAGVQTPRRHPALSSACDLSRRAGLSDSHTPGPVG